MRIDRLELENFHGFERLTLDFKGYQTTVLIGINGCGKSSVLHALAVALSRLPPFSEFPEISERDRRDPIDGTRRPIRTEWSLSGSDIKIGADSCRIAVSLEWKGLQDTFVIHSEKRVLSGLHSAFSGRAKVYSEFSSGIKRQGDETVPVVVYYPVNRFVARSLEETPYDGGFDILAAYHDALIAGQISFQRFFEWYRVREDVENEKLRWKLPAREESEETIVEKSLLDPQLEAVRQAIYSLLPEDFSSLRVERTPRPRMSIVKQGTKLFLDQLSDGEKCLLAMSGDLARRMVIANPGLEKPFESPGVVLIDEVDLHLHPEWQRKVVPALQRTFPNCQFIVTTHSPQVLGSTRDVLVYLIAQENGSIRALRYESPFGRDSNWILEMVMGVEDRPPDIKNKVMRYLEHVENYEMEKARELEGELALELGDDYPELVKGRARRRRKEILGK